MAHKRYPDFFDINPEWLYWQPPAIKNDPEPNPPFRIGAPVRASSLGELMALAAAYGFLQKLLIDTGYYLDHEGPQDRENEARRRSGREL